MAWNPAYTGKYLDLVTDLQNNLHRWYDAYIAKWISTDPIGFAAGDANLYRYVGNGPLWQVDPTGMRGEASSVFSKTFSASFLIANGTLIDAQKNAETMQYAEKPEGSASEPSYPPFTPTPGFPSVFPVVPPINPLPVGFVESDFTIDVEIVGVDFYDASEDCRILRNKSLPPKIDFHNSFNGFSIGLEQQLKTRVITCIPEHEELMNEAIKNVF